MSEQQKGAAVPSEMLEVRAKAQSWIDSMIVAGVSENASVSAIHLALVERLLASGGVEGAIHWLRGQIDLVEKHGPTLLVELRKRGH